MTYTASFTCPGCERTYTTLHYSDTRAPVTACSCGWRLPHEEALRRIEAENVRIAGLVWGGLVFGDLDVADRILRGEA